METNILCHKCKHGAPNGKMIECACTEIGTDVFKYFAPDNERKLQIMASIHLARQKQLPKFNPVAFALPIYASLNNLCPHYSSNAESRE
jgi:hypothetical protein